MPLQKAVFASHNQHKLQEVREMLSPFLEVISLDDINLEQECEETGETFEDNALIKAQDIASRCDYAVISDDSGLAVDALGGFPGVHSARFMEGSPYKDKCEAIIGMLKDKEDRSASFNTAICYIPADRCKTVIFKGQDLGMIIEEYPQDEQNGFGYDPVFYSYALEKTYGQATAEEKNSVSHRGRALRKFVQYLEEAGTL